MGEIMTRLLLPALLMSLLAGPVAAQGRGNFDDVVKRDEATVTPVTAKRGETVTWRLTVEIEALGWHTYPTKQPEANAKSYVNKITPKAGGPLAFVEGTLVEPADPILKPVPEEQI